MIVVYRILRGDALVDTDNNAMYSLEVMHSLYIHLFQTTE